MDIRKDIIDKYLNTKKNRLIAGCVTGLIVLGCGGGIVYATRDTSPKLQLKKNTINLEYGKEFKADFDTLVDTKGLNKEDKEYLKKNLKIKSDIKNDTESVTKEDGTTEEKDRGFAKVGDYKVNLTYKDETKTVKVVVKDTTAPEITVPENIEILQGTDLSTFDFKSLIIATDLATINELTVDYSTVDINVPAEYTVKASIEDANGNKTTERGVGMEFGAEAYMNNLLIPVIGCGLSVPFHLPDWKIFRSRSESAVPSSAHWEQLCS